MDNESPSSHAMQNVNQSHSNGNISILYYYAIQAIMFELVSFLGVLSTWNIQGSIRACVPFCKYALIVPF